MAEEKYANTDDFEMSSQEKDKSTCANARPEDAVDSNHSATVRNSRWAVGGLGLLCVLLLALGIGVTVLYMKERDQLQDISLQRDQLQAQKQQLLSSYNAISMERDQLLANNTNLARQVDQLRDQEIKLQDRISKLTKRCPSGWIYFNTKCYRYDTTATTWSDSRAHCQSQGGDLVIIGNREEQVFIHGLARGKIVWIGLKRANGKWKWVNNDEASTTFWVVRQPNNGGEECGALDSCYSNPLSSWHDYYCNDEHAFICQISTYI